MAEQQYTLGNIERYLNFGDRRPPEKQLCSMLARVKPTTHGGADVIAADMCIDLAAWGVDSTKGLLADADSWLSGVIADTVDMKADGYNTAVMEENATTAYLRQWELPNWHRAIVGEAPTIDYQGALDACQSILALITDNQHKANNLLREFMPLLMGIRAETRQPGSGWMGRLALSREDCRPVLSQEKNYNWDAAVWRESCAQVFLQPSDKWQVKTTKSKGAARYEKAGVRVIKASNRGFHTPRYIMAGCIAETGMDFLVDDARPYSTERLDEITAQISDRLFEDRDADAA